jgi:hypothetical protein
MYKGRMHCILRGAFLMVPGPRRALPLPLPLPRQVDLPERRRDVERAGDSATLMIAITSSQSSCRVVSCRVVSCRVIIFMQGYERAGARDGALRLDGHGPLPGRTRASLRS